MTRSQAIVCARELSNKDVRRSSRDEVRKAHIEIKKLFEDHNLNWKEVMN